MALTQFDDQNKNELSMIEVARAILSDRHETMGFNDLLNEVQAFTGKSDEEIRTRLSQFYTDLNIDGSFISLGDTMWGLRSWYPIDSIDEAVHLDLEEEVEGKPKKKKKRKKINAFLADADDDDDVIDYNDDDPEDDDFDVADTDDDDSTDDDDDKKDTDGDFNHDEVSGGLGDEISGIKTNVDDDYGSGDIEH